VQLWRQWTAGAAKQASETNVLDAGASGGRSGGTESAPAFENLPNIGLGVLRASLAGIFEHESGHSELTAAPMYVPDPNLFINRVNTVSVFLFRCASMRCHGALWLHSGHLGGSLAMRPSQDRNPTTATAVVRAPDPVPRYRQATTRFSINGGGDGGGGGDNVSPSNRYDRRTFLLAAASKIPHAAPERQLQPARTSHVDRLSAKAVADAELRRLYLVNAMYEAVQEHQTVYAVLHARHSQTVRMVFATGCGKTTVRLLLCAFRRHASDAAELASAFADVGCVVRKEGTAGSSAAASAVAAVVGGKGAAALASRVPPSPASGSPLLLGPPVTVVLSQTVAVVLNARDVADTIGSLAAIVGSRAHLHLDVIFCITPHLELCTRHRDGSGRAPRNTCLHLVVIF